MIWSRMILWVLRRGLVTGAIVGVILGTLLYPIIGTIIGLFLGGIVGAILGCLDGISLAVITRFAYVSADVSSRYPKLVYAVPILINTVPIFIICLIGAASTFSWDKALEIVLAGAIPITIMAIVTHYSARVFLKSTDWLMPQKASRNPPPNMLSLGEN